MDTTGLSADEIKAKEKERRRDEKRQLRRSERERLMRSRQHKDKRTSQMTGTTSSRTKPVAGERRRLRTDHIFGQSKDLVVKEDGNVGGDVLNVDSFDHSPITTPRETFTCVCTDCHGSDTCVADFRCTAMTVKEDSGERTSYGCINHSASLMELTHCIAGKDEITNKNTIRTMCCVGDMCNNVPPPRLPSTEAPATQSSTNGVSYIHPAVFVAVPAVLCIVLLILIILVIYKRMKSTQKKRKEKERIRNYLGDNLSAQPLTEDCSIELPDLTSGSGSGMPMLIQRTVAKSVTLLDQIGTGKYGNVYKGLYQGSPVAVKIFLSKDDSSWASENEIYTTLLLRHENILGFIASDMISCDSVTQFWLICHYHEQGSLYDFLNQPYNIITPSQCLLMLYSAASGLVHLHTEIFGTQAKPAIAHRDIKSKNILVKEDGSCCIADLGLAVMHKSDRNILEPRSRNTMVGTKRYMAPEVLSESMNGEDFEAYKRADIYSFSLVMWETAQCARRGRYAEEKYHMPYGGLVANDPTFEEMRRVVVTQRRRPAIPSDWANYKIFRSMSKLIKECWNDSPSARLTILRVKKTLSDMLEEVRDCKEYV